MSTTNYEIRDPSDGLPPVLKLFIAALGVALLGAVGFIVVPNIKAAQVELARQQADHVTMILGRVLTARIDGRSVRAFGTDICPRHDSEAMRSMFGDTADAGQAACIVVRPTTTKVHVYLAAEGSPVRSEEWLVVRDANRMSFRRPDGSAVIVTDN